MAPATMIAALVVLAFSGSFGGFGALGQLLSGPAVPVGSSLAGGQEAPAAPTAPLPVVPTSAPTAAAALRAARSSPGGEHPGRGGPSGGGSRPSGPGGGGTGQFAGGGHGVVPPPPRTPTPKPNPTPTPPTPTGPVTSVVNKVLGVGEAVTGALPAPVAQVGTGALQSLGQTLNKLLPGL